MDTLLNVISFFLHEIKEIMTFFLEKRGFGMSFINEKKEIYEPLFHEVLLLLLCSND
jgi:hypothetical protein